MTAAALAGVGVDAVDLPRFRRVLARRPGIVHRVFTEGERAYAQRHADPSSRLAARFAVKEAVMKALGVGLGAFRLRDVEVGRLDSGAPTVVLHGSAAELATRRGVSRWHVSLTHSEAVAVAVVLAER